ncbi:MAG: hypothetical protein AVDCRST_MAG85-2995 [uncultured Solirubrobacteraceae bacterium]|uniref:Uncharacterized protein n=1 Tax=uncultured Solirubrobacteraceae bacterium TaxID=1162706 RepID=A0A6J4THP6_9ACTN|nr:MAG: hypothetical protein AVDCRST_MAG85-2995 [uncultured Solirubrobacteraceae bacterium]
MLNRTTLGTTLTIAALAIGAPSAFAAPYTEDGKTVCNEAAWVSQGGTLDALDGDPFPHPARFQRNLHAHRGNGAGLINAAGKSPALALCQEVDIPTDGGGGGDGTGGGGDGTGGNT